MTKWVKIYFASSAKASGDNVGEVHWANKPLVSNYKLSIKI